ncbi:putative WD40/YVTN repeat-like-containing domain superfamily [Helianthus anomalus]
MFLLAVWDIRNKMQIHALSGHDNTVCSVFTRPTVKYIRLIGSDDARYTLLGVPNFE